MSDRFTKKDLDRLISIMRDQNAGEIHSLNVPYVENKVVKSGNCYSVEIKGKVEPYLAFTLAGAYEIMRKHK